MIDYRDLLHKYINHVGWNEGTIYTDKKKYGNPSSITDEEFEELNKLADLPIEIERNYA